MEISGSVLRWSERRYSVHCGAYSRLPKGVEQGQMCVGLVLGQNLKLLLLNHQVDLLS